MRNPEQVIWDFIQQWLKKAESDLKSAKTLLNTEMGDYFTCAHRNAAKERFNDTVDTGQTGI